MDRFPPDKAGASSYSLFRLLEAGSYQAIKQRLIADPSLVTQINRDGQTVLFLAITARRPDIVAIGLGAGANPNHRDREGWTPLLHSASIPTDCCTELLLAHPSTDRNATTPFGWSPLLIAITRQHWGAARLLLGAGANVRQANAVGLTPLDLATQMTMPEDLRQGIVQSGCSKGALLGMGE